jgi:hypothetical protein
MSRCVLALPLTAHLLSAVHSDPVHPSAPVTVPLPPALDHPAAEVDELSSLPQVRTPFCLTCLDGSASSIGEVG